MGRRSRKKRRAGKPSTAVDAPIPPTAPTAPTAPAAPEPSAPVDGAVIDEALALHRQGELDQAVVAYQEALLTFPGYAGLHSNLGAALLDLGRDAEAEAACLRALALEPGLAPAHKNLGDARARRQDWAGAMESYASALTHAPDDPGALLGLGIALRGQGRLEDAATVFQGARSLAPVMAELDYQLGLTLRETGDWGGAAAAFERLTAMGLDDPELLRLRAGARLASGDFERGLADLAGVLRGAGRLERESRAPLWDGEDLSGKSVLFWSDQGLGDAIMMARYARLAAESGAMVHVEVPPPLVRLFASCPWIASVNEEDPPVDVHAPFGLLPALFQTRVESIPSWPAYLEVTGDPQVRPSRNGLSVGIVWAGSAGHENDHNRSLPLDLVGDLVGVPGTQFFSLQVGDPRLELATRPWAFNVVDWGGRVSDFLDTARLIRGLDLVVSVDTSVAHLAGALGVPVWVLLPVRNEWFWLADRSDSPWYPSATLFRQGPETGWESVIDRVRDALMGVVHRRHTA